MLSAASGGVQRLRPPCAEAAASPRAPTWAGGISYSLMGLGGQRRPDVAASLASLGASGLVLAVELVEVVEQLAQRGRKVLAVRRLADMRLVGLASDGHGQVILEE